MLVDSHCHLNYLETPELCLAAARERGVNGFLCIAVDEAGSTQVLALADQHADVWATIGEHPDSVAGPPGALSSEQNGSARSGSWIGPLLDSPRVVAVGETGLDYFHARDSHQRERQLQSFDLQLSLAQERQLPVVVHTRQAESDTLKLMADYPDAIGVLHCFTESWSMASRALDMGYYISISGIVTFRNAENVRDVALRVPEDRLLVETDSPWLAPVPHRGKTNEPAFVADTAKFLSELRGCKLEDLARATTANFRRLFPLTQNSSS